MDNLGITIDFKTDLERLEISPIWRVESTLRAFYAANYDEVGFALKMYFQSTKMVTDEDKTLYGTLV